MCEYTAILRVSCGQNNYFDNYMLPFLGWFHFEFNKIQDDSVHWITNYPPREFQSSA